MKEGDGVNKNLLVSKMKLIGDNQDTLARALDLSLTRTNAKINGTDGAQFNPDEMKVIMARYNLTPDEVVEIFLSENDTNKDIR